MATTHSTIGIRTNEVSNRDPGLIAEVGAFWRQFTVAAFNPYRPEQHYMRGPGPAWRARHIPGKAEDSRSA